MTSARTIRFGVIGVNHGHIYGQTALLQEAGAELAGYYAPEPELQAEYGAKVPGAVAVESPAVLLEDPTIDLVVTAGIPSERAQIGLDAMQHGKDFMTDKPAFTTHAQLEEVRRVQAQTGRIYSVNYSERMENRATVKAAELVRAGAIGEVVNTVGLGPHRTRWPTRPWWFTKREKFGGILIDIASHQFDQFLYFTQASERNDPVEIVSSQVANYQHPQHPEFEDFGDVMVRTPTATGYIRVDWFTPDGLDSWGDTRLTVIGSDGYIEVRKNIDIAGREGSDHLFLIDQKGTQYIDCQDVELPYGRQLLYDIEHRTQTAMDQAHCFRAMELALDAQAAATRLGHLVG